ncbi:MAG: phage tail tape measure protein [Chloroflexota bacterium]|nr:phage tail tape measure protein [Chloroflexota bacterium]
MDPIEIVIKAITDQAESAIAQLTEQMAGIGGAGESGATSADGALNQIAEAAAASAEDISRSFGSAMEGVATDAEDAATAADGALRGIGERFGGWGAGFGLQMAGQQIAAFGQQTTGVIKGAVGAAGNFQAALTALVTGAGELPSNLAAVRQGVLTIAQQVGDTSPAFSGLTSALYMVDSAGYHGAAGLDVLKAAAQGAKVGFAPLPDVANAVTSALNEYAGTAGAMNAVQATNTLIAAVGEGKTHLADMSTALGTIGPAASKVGISLADATGALATMTMQGIPADKAATYLRQSLLSWADAKGPAIKAMQSVGLSSTELYNTMHTKGLPAAIAEMQDAVASKFVPGSAQYVATMAQMMGGTKSMQAALTLTGAGLPVFLSNVDTINQKVKAGGDSVLGWSNVQQDFNQQLDQFKAQATALAIRVGDDLMPAVERLLPRIEALVGWFEQHPTVTKMAAEVAGLAGAVAAVVGPALAAAGSFAMMSQMLHFGGHGGGGGGGLFKGVQDAAKGLRGAMGDVGEAGSKLVGAIARPFAEIGQLMAGPLERAGAFLTERVGGIAVSVGGKLMSGLRTVTGPIAGALRGAVAPIGEAFSEAFGGVMGFFSEFGGMVMGELRTVFGPMMGMLGRVLGPVAGIVSDALGPIGSAVAGMLGPLADLAAPLLGLLGPLAGLAAPVALAVGAIVILGTAFAALTIHTAPVRDAVAHFKAALAGGWSTVKDAVGGALGNIRSHLGPLMNALQGLGTSLVTHILPAASAFATFAAGRLSLAIKGVGQFIVAEVLPALTHLVQWITGTVIPAASTLAGFLFGTVVPAFMGLVGHIVGDVLPILAGLGKFVQTVVLPVIGDLAGFVVKELLPAFAQVVQWLSKNVLPVFDAVARFVGKVVVPILTMLAQYVIVPLAKVLGGALWQALKTVGGMLGNILGPALQTVAKLFNGLTDALSDPKVMSGIQGFLKNFGKLASDLAGFFTGLANDALQWGANIITSIANGITSAIGAVTNAVGGVLGIIKDHLPHSPVKTGPLAESGGLEVWGGNVIASIAAGMAGSGAAIQRALGTALALPGFSGGLAGAYGTTSAAGVLGLPGGVAGGHVTVVNFNGPTVAQSTQELADNVASRLNATWRRTNTGVR